MSKFDVFVQRIFPGKRFEILFDLLGAGIDRGPVMLRLKRIGVIMRWYTKGPYLTAKSGSCKSIQHNGLPERKQRQ